MRILVVEDDKKTAGYLRKGLTESGYVVSAAFDGEEGLHCVLTEEFDLMILDVMLPKLNGWAVIEELRRQGRHLPVLFLTAIDSVQDRVRGLDLGADDYLVKPFTFSELLARVRSILRRGPVRLSESVRIMDLNIDFLQHKVLRGGKQIDLTPKEFQLLGLLTRRAGEVISRTLLTELVWDMSFDGGSNVVDVHVRRLRSKIDEPFPQKLIHTVRGVGYVLEARV